MSEDNKKDLHEEQTNHNSKELSDQELEGVGGGFAGIQLWDSCKHRWDRDTCTAWGHCVHLETIESEYTEWEYRDVFRCKKGCFQSVTYRRGPAGVST